MIYSGWRRFLICTREKEREGDRERERTLLSHKSMRNTEKYRSMFINVVGYQNRPKPNKLAALETDHKRVIFKKHEKESKLTEKV